MKILSKQSSIAVFKEYERLGIFSSILGTHTHGIGNFSRVLFKIGIKKYMTAILQWFNEHKESNCLGWHLTSFKHSEVALDFKDFNFFSILFFLFCNFQLGTFYYAVGKKDAIFNWEYDWISAIK